MKCVHCHEFHDVEDEIAATGTGHSYVQAETIYQCEKAQFPDDEALKE